MKILLVFGTRPEAIKMCPLVIELRKRAFAKILVCVTGQHREMLDQVLTIFRVKADYDLSIMRAGQTLFDITENVLIGMKEILEREHPDIVLVHGDTSTAFAASLASFYLQIPVGHIEAGLRTYNLTSPFPEEFNRRAISLLATYHFAPTDSAKENLLREGIAAKQIFMTGNTVIDALRYTVKQQYTHPLLEWARDSKLILVTCHRRENIGAPMRSIFRAIRRVTAEHSEVKVIFPVHQNPAVLRVAEAVLGDQERIRLTSPLDVEAFHNILARCDGVLSDSGGIQEESAALGKPLLLLRNTTERPEGIVIGSVRPVGTDEESVYRQFSLFLENNTVSKPCSQNEKLYGDGTACQKIAEILCERKNLLCSRE